MRINPFHGSPEDVTDAVLADPGRGDAGTRAGVDVGRCAGVPCSRHSGPVATGRSGSDDQADHEPGNSAASTPAIASAAISCAAVTPEPQ